LPLDLIVNYGAFGVNSYSRRYTPLERMSPSERAAEALAHLERFKVFSEIYAVRQFQLVLCVDAFNLAVEDTMRVLESAVEAERMNGGFNYLSCEPLIISEMRSRHTRRFDDQVGAKGEGVISTCAL